jgi:predicted small metal-binding protein
LLNISLRQTCGSAKRHRPSSDALRDTLSASSKEELMEEVAVHARRAHNLTEIPKDVRSKIEAAIRKV